MNNLTPKMAARNFCNKKIKQGFKPIALHEYKDINGNPIYWRIRLKNPNTGEKLLWPMHKDENEKYQLKEPNFTGNKKPIYRLQDIHNNPETPVYIHEREKCADEFSKLGFISTTSGSWSSAKSADWLILKNRKVFIWPDSDDDGLRYAKDVTEILSELNCDVWWIDIAKLNLPRKGDCVDWLARTKASPSDIHSLPLIRPFNKAENAAAPEIAETNTKCNKTTLLLKLVDNIEFFHDEQKQTYATFKNTDHFETWPIESRQFKSWLAHQFWKTYNTTVNDAALRDAICTMNGNASFEGNCQTVFMRVGYFDEKIYLNLANAKWQAIEISGNGWQILDKPPIKFRGTANMQPLPIPIQNGDINFLWKHVNIPFFSRILVLAWMLECLRPNTHFPVLVLIGLQGSGKSRTQEILRKLVDPSLPNLRSAPKKSDDIFIAAANNWLVSYNNASKLSTENQDDLCSLSTGGGFGRRTLYDTSLEAVADIKRPSVINGIGELITRQDLLDRSIILELPSITEDTRKSDVELDLEFSQDYPLILGGLLNIFSEVLKILPTIKLTSKPRMASFAELGTALEKVLNMEPGSFIKEYKGNYQASMASALENSPVAVALLKFMQNDNQYNCTYGELFQKLSNVSYRPTMPGWPKSAKGLANALKRQAPALEIVGIKISFEDKPRRDGYHLTILNTSRKQYYE